MTEFICLLGGPAFSDFHKQKLSDDLRGRIGRDISFTAHFIYFVEHQHDLSGENLERLAALLQAEVMNHAEATGMLLVLPRMGTQSPWSTKATDIAHLCGLESINRIERGTLFRLPLEFAEPETIKGVKPYIHDRMTQTVLGNLEDARAIFDHHPPRTDHRALRPDHRHGRRQSRGVRSASPADERELPL